MTKCWFCRSPGCFLILPASCAEGPSGFAVELPEEEQRSQTGAVSVRNLFLIAVRYGMLLWQAIHKTYLCIYTIYICRFSCIDCAYTGQHQSIMKVLNIWYIQPQTPVVLGCFFSGYLANGCHRLATRYLKESVRHQPPGTLIAHSVSQQKKPYLAKKTSNKLSPISS
jgi:hypothetical protein